MAYPRPKETHFLKLCFFDKFKQLRCRTASKPSMLNFDFYSSLLFKLVLIWMLFVCHRQGNPVVKRIWLIGLN